MRIEYQMLKKVLTIYLITMALLFVSCQNISKINENISDEDQNVPAKHRLDDEKIDSVLAYKMRKDYSQYLTNLLGDAYKDSFIVDEIWVLRYFFNLSGCEIAYMGSCLNYNDAETPVEIAGYTIVFPSGQILYAYKDSKFYTIKEAFEDGLITKEDVYEIGTQAGVNFKEQNPIP